MQTKDALHKHLEKTFSILLPEAFSDLVYEAYQYACQEDYVDELRFTTYYPQFDFASYVEQAVFSATAPPVPLSYYAAIPEYRMFGSFGIDGISVGFLVHAPELDTRDHQVVRHDPYTGFYRYGEHLRAVMDRLIAIYTAQTGTKKADITHFRDVMRYIRNQYGGRFVFDDDGLAEIKPAIPQGWHYAPSEDQVGVLAPRGLFAPYPAVSVEYRESCDPAIEAAQKALADGYPATALLGLRESIANHADGFTFGTEPTREFIQTWQAAYQALNRPWYAEMIGRRYTT